METKHLLYDNWLYYKLQSDQIRKQIRVQEKIIHFVSLHGVNLEQAAAIYYKRDCLYFELHRRAFSNCIVQLFSYHKVKPWLARVHTETRCFCCKPEYYEFKFDCHRIEIGELPICSFTSTILSTRALSGGRSFFLMNEPATPSFAEDAVQECGIAVARMSLNKPTPMLPTIQLRTSIIHKVSSISKQFQEPPSVSAIKNAAQRWSVPSYHLVAIPNVKFVGNSSACNQPVPGPSGLGATRRTTNEAPGFRTFKGRHFGYPHRRYRASRAFNRADDEKPSYSYKPLKQDENSTTEEKVPKVNCHYGFELPKEDKSESEKKNN